MLLLLYSNVRVLRFNKLFLFSSPSILLLDGVFVFIGFGVNRKYLCLLPPGFSKSCVLLFLV